MKQARTFFLSFDKSMLIEKSSYIFIVPSESTAEDRKNTLYPLLVFCLHPELGQVPNHAFCFLLAKFSSAKVKQNELYHEFLHLISEMVVIYDNLSKHIGPKGQRI